MLLSREKILKLRTTLILHYEIIERYELKKSIAFLLTIQQLGITFESGIINEIPFRWLGLII